MNAGDGVVRSNKSNTGYLPNSAFARFHSIASQKFCPKCQKVFWTIVPERKGGLCFWCFYNL